MREQPTIPASSVRSDLIVLGCLWVAVIAGELMLFDSGESGPDRLGFSGAGQRLPPVTAVQTPTRGASQAATTPTALTPEMSLPRSLEQAARGNTPVVVTQAMPATEHVPILNSPTENVSGGASPTPPQTARPAPTAAPTPVSATPPKPVSAPPAATADELLRLVTPAGVKAHGAISGAGSATTLTIACAACTYDAFAGRLGVKGTRDALRAGGVRVVVLINGQDSWTFML